MSQPSSVYQNWYSCSLEEANHKYCLFFKLKIYSDVLTMRVMYLEVVCTQSWHSAFLFRMSTEPSLGLPRAGEGGERLRGGRKEQGMEWNEKELLRRALSTALCDHSHVTRQETANWAADIWLVQSFWNFERFYTKIEISGFSWEIFGVGHTWPAFLHGNTIGWKWVAAAPLKQASTLQLETVHAPHPPTHP